MVKVNVRFSMIFKEATGVTAATLDVPEGTVEGLIGALINQFGSRLGERIVDPNTGELRRFVNTFVNGRDIRNLQGKATKLNEGDEVRLIPAVAGGRFLGFARDQIMRSDFNG
jgi:molybdopterin synthase sulfur carrier subunit